TKCRHIQRTKRHLRKQPYQQQCSLHFLHQQQPRTNHRPIKRKWLRRNNRKRSSQRSHNRWTRSADSKICVRCLCKVPGTHATLTQFLMFRLVLKLFGCLAPKQLAKEVITILSLGAVGNYFFFLLVPTHQSNTTSQNDNE